MVLNIWCGHRGFGLRPWDDYVHVHVCVDSPARIPPVTLQSVQGDTGLTHPLIFWHLDTAPEYGTECFGRFFFARIRKRLKGLKACSCWGILFLGVLSLLWVQVEIAHRAYYYAWCVWLMIRTRIFPQTAKFHRMAGKCGLQGCSLGPERLDVETVSRCCLKCLGLVSVLRVERLGLVLVLEV